MSSRDTKIEEPKILYKFSLIPKSEEDLKALKADLLANERVGIHLYINLFVQNILDYEAGRRSDLATLIVREIPKEEKCSE